jgi:RNase P/RNase MRP subunit POP5
VLEALRATTPKLWLVEFTGSAGLVRTTHLEKDAAIRALTHIVTMAGEPVAVTTIGTSGTIRAATRKYLHPPVHVRRNGQKNPYK